MKNAIVSCELTIISDTTKITFHSVLRQLDIHVINEKLIQQL